MRKVLMVMFMTLDGQAQFPAYDEAPYTNDVEDPMWTPRMGSIDTILLGGNSYTKWAAYWPQQKDRPGASEFQKQFSRFADRAEKVVFSKKTQTPTWENSRIATRKPAEEIAALKSRAGKDIALGGGPRLAQSLLAEDLVDEVLIAVSPSLVGRGKPLFRTVDDPDFADDVIPKGSPGRHDFVLVEAQGLADSQVFLHSAKWLDGEVVM